MTALTVAAGLLFLAVYMGLIISLRHFARWACDREEARRMPVLPSSAEVSATEADLPKFGDHA